MNNLTDDNLETNINSTNNVELNIAVDRWALPQKISTQEGFSSLFTVGSKVYLTKRNTGGIYMFDLMATTTDPANAIYLTTNDRGEIYSVTPLNEWAKPQLISLTESFTFFSMTVIEGVAFLTSTKGGIYYFVLSSEVEPKCLDSTVGFGFRHIAKGPGNVVYLTTNGSDGIYSFHVQSKDKPVQLEGTANHGFDGIAIKDDIIYVAAHGDGGIYTYDLKSETAPEQLPNTRGMGFRDITIRNNMAYLTTQSNDGVFVFDLETKATPQQLPNSVESGFGSIGLRSMGRN